jgi:glycosyltransferase involved in cell wall biosynthesis
MSRASVLFDARSAMSRRTTGWERYSRSLLHALRNGLGVDVLRYIGPHFGSRHLIPGANPLPLGLALRTRAFRGAVHFPTFPPPPHISRMLGSRLVFTVHDSTWWLFPETASRLGELVYRPWAERALSTATIVTATRSVADELTSSFDLPDDRVFIAPLANDLPIVNSRPNERGRPYILSVASIEPRKNLDRLVAAYQASGLVRTHDLLLVGRQAWGSLPPGVDLMSGLSDQELAALYAGATATVLVSLYEGFGLPLVESLAQGTKVICSDLPVFREVTGGAATFVDHLSVDSIAEGLTTGVAAAGPGPQTVERIRGTTWEATATSVLSAYERAAAGG